MVSRDHFYLTVFQIASVTESEISRAAGCCCESCSGWGAAAGVEERSWVFNVKLFVLWKGVFPFALLLTVFAFSWWCICDATHHLVSGKVHWTPLADAKVGPNSIMECILVTAYLCQDALYNMNHAPDPPYVTYFPCILSTEYITWMHNGETVYAFFPCFVSYMDGWVWVN